MRFEKIEGKVFAYYSDYFHDGSLLKITQTGKDLTIEVESAAIWVCDNRDDIPLSERNTLYGILHFKDVWMVRKDDKEVSKLEIECEYGSLSDFNLTKSSLEMCGSWVGFGENEPEERTWFSIEVYAKEIYWENTADMQDPSLIGKFKGISGEPPYGYPQWYLNKHMSLQERQEYAKRMNYGEDPSKGHRRVDHCHRSNINATNRHEECVDEEGNPCGRYEARAHMYSRPGEWKSPPEGWEELEALVYKEEQNSKQPTEV